MINIKKSLVWELIRSMMRWTYFLNGCEMVIYDYELWTRLIYSQQIVVISKIYKFLSSCSYFTSTGEGREYIKLKSLV